MAKWGRASDNKNQKNNTVRLYMEIILVQVKWNEIRKFIYSQDGIYQQKESPSEWANLPLVVVLHFEGLKGLELSKI